MMNYNRITSLVTLAWAALYIYHLLRYNKDKD